MKRTEIAFFLTFLSVAYSFIALASVTVFIMQGMRWNTQDTPWVVLGLAGTFIILALSVALNRLNKWSEK